MGNNRFSGEGIMKQGYGFIAKKVMRDKDLSIEAKSIYAYLCSYSGAGDTAYPSVSRMCGDLKISEARFYTHRKKLEAKGYIVIEKHRNEKGWQNNVYRLPFVPTPQNLSTQNLGTQNLSTQNKGTISNSSKSNSIKSNNKDNSSNSKKPEYGNDSPYIKLAKHLFSYLKKRNPKHRVPNYQTWADDFRKTVELDKRTVKEVKDVIDWCQQDDFWQNNILSAGKLRKQFDQLYLKMNETNGTKTKKDWSEWEF